MIYDDYELIVFDVDGTLRECTVEGQPCPNKPGEWRLLPGVKEVMSDLVGRVKIGVASNQAGVAYGFFTGSEARQLINDTLIEAMGIKIHHEQIQICTHSKEADCVCRKPKTNMLEYLEFLWVIQDKKDILFVGDMLTDKLTSENFGCDFMWGKDFFEGYFQ